MNDLDLEVVSPTNVTSFPFSINKASPQTVATATGANTVDPIEQLVVNGPADGTWTIRVKGTAVPNGAPQQFGVRGTVNF